MTHGATRGVKQGLRRQSAEYVCWNNIKRRCYSKSNSHYKYYGGKGIVVCPRWLESYANFLADMGPRPSDAHSIDRIDGNGNYEPGNCRWATDIEQSRNRSFKNLITFNGISLTRKAWARRIGMSNYGLSRRLKTGWSVKDALTKPVRKTRTSK